MAQAIFQGLCGNVKKAAAAQTENEAEEFEEFVGRIAKRDWEERRIVLPSIVVAQAMKESARGKSELAREAHALFGIKKNGWTGKTYRKAATEQRTDGSFFTVDNVEWRAEVQTEEKHYVTDRS